MGIWECVEIAVMCGIPLFIFYCAYVKLSDVMGFARGWAAVVAVMASLNPVLWALFAPYSFRFIGYWVVLLLLLVPIENIIRMEAKRYGLKFKWNNEKGFDDLIAQRRALEQAPPPGPAELYSGEFSCDSL